ncbi:T cell receptor gamma constant 2 isoform X1 [Equus caballus]|uniref:T cell receptor gamma constant 2 isoform X1 n=2 Tax=Equus caballus TaxID=9796 RepID=UPI0038B2A2D0
MPQSLYSKTSRGTQKIKLPVHSFLTTSYIMNLRRRLSFCRSCNQCDSSGWSKKFGEGTKLTVIPSDRRLPADISPKPTIFLPSIAEIKRHKAGTHLCLLENFFPDVIKVYWKEKNGNRILESQEGKTMKTSDTYMKLSWLTVTEKSMDKEHKCIVQHEKNKGGVDQEILFPSVNQVVASMTTTIAPTTASTTEKRIATSKATTVGSTTAYTTEESIATSKATTVGPTTAYTTEESIVTSMATTVGSTTAYTTEESIVTTTKATTAPPTEHSGVPVIIPRKACLKDETSPLQLQLSNVSAYYTYLLLLLKGAIYFAIIAFGLFRRTEDCDMETVCNRWWQKEVNWSSFIFPKRDP